MKYKIRHLFTILFFCFAFNTIYSQIPDFSGKQSVQSPNATSQGKFGDIPVSLFTGAANISIPLTEIKSGSINLTISLQYDAGGCRPDQHPTWVGLNWSLQAGGVIRRNTNGTFDESIHKYDTNTTKGQLSYYNQYTTLSNSNWNNSLQYTGKDLAPDEFSFTFNGISGKFMLNHEGKWIVQSKEDLSLKVVHELQTNYSIHLGSGSVNVPRAYTKFILTTGDGTKYIFGGQSNAIEFSVPAIHSNIESYNWTSSIPPDYNELAMGWETYIQPSAWHLSEIISPSGNHIKLFFTTDFSFQQATYSELSWGRPCGQPITDVHRIKDINQTEKFLIKSSYLDKIETDNGVVCTFSKSISNELNWVFKEKPQVNDYFKFKPSYSWRYHKLDNIEVKTNNKITKKIDLAYIENSTERLKLKEVGFLSLSDNQIDFNYRMEYNNKLLPTYNSGWEDHWGFYNGSNYWGNLSGQGVLPGSTTDVQVPNLTDYYNSREANPDFMDAEIIKRIIYPTGGYSEFIFEPHEYSKVVKQNASITLESLPVSKIAGGLRIKRIETYSGFSTSPQVKEYFYTNSYINGGSFSSGVLSGEPVYYESGNTLGSSGDQFYKFSSNPLNYLNTTNGNHITYSQVTEKSSEGYTVYSYTNQDNGYLDKNSFAQANSANIVNKNSKKLFGKLDLERGQLLSTKYYAEDKFLLKEILNEYNDDPLRYNKYVRSIQNVNDPYICAYSFLAFPIYTFYPYLKKETTIEYFRTGTFVSKSVNNTYDSNSNLLRTASFINSGGNEVKTKYKYPGDYSLPPLNTIPATNKIHDIAALVTNNVKNIPVEVNSSIIKNGVEYITGGKLNYFEDLKLEKTFELEANSSIDVNNFNFSIINPTGFVYDSRYKEKISYPKYDNKGNILEVKLANGITTSYIWGYNNQYPIAKVVNATYQEITNVLGSFVLSELNSGFTTAMPPSPPLPIEYTDTEIRSILGDLRTSLPNAEVTIFTYRPLIGITSETDSKGKTTYYEFDKFGKHNLTKDSNGRIIKKYEYNNKLFKRISLSTNNLNFENVAYGTSVSKKIRVTNSSSSPFIVSGLSVPTGYTYTINGSSSLAPGEYADVTITFSPSVAGNYTGIITVLSDAEGFNTITVNGSAVVSKIINISGDLNFGIIMRPPGNPYGCTYKTMTITNSGNATLTITGIQTQAPFSVNWTNGTIAPGQSKNITVSFCPSSQYMYGSFGEKINVISDKTSGNNGIDALGAVETL